MQSGASIYDSYIHFDNNTSLSLQNVSSPLNNQIHMLNVHKNDCDVNCHLLERCHIDKKISDVIVCI